MNLVGETGSDIADGGDDSDVGDELSRAAASMINRGFRVALVVELEQVGPSRKMAVDYQLKKLQINSEHLWLHR